MRKSSAFFRLEKPIGDGFISVFEFHTVVNGKTYYREHEELDGHERWRGKIIYCTPENGNKKYQQLKNNGYKFTGKYEMDICGHKEVLK